MTDYVADVGGVISVGGIETPGPPPAAPSTLGATGHAKIWMELVLVHPTDGTLTLRIGDICFIPEKVSSAAPVYPAVINWGALREFLATAEGEVRDGTVELELQGDAILVPTGSTKRYALGDLLQEAQVFDSAISFYQWSEAGFTSTLIWRGFIDGMPQVRYDKTAQIVTLEVGQFETGLQRSISQVVNPGGFTEAPKESHGLMIPFWRGNIISALNTGAESQEAVYLGFPGRFVKGVLVSENLASLKAQYDFARNNGIKNAAKIDAGIANDPSEPTAVYIYLPGAGAFCMVDAESLVLSNTTAQISAQFPIQPKVWTAVRGVGVGSQMSAGFAATAYKLTDDDPNNFLETTVGDYTVALNLPPLTIPGFVCTEAIMMIDVWADPSGPASTRTIDWGLWNIAKTTTPGYFGTGGVGGIAGASGRVTMNIGAGGDPRQRYYMQDTSGPPVKQYYLPRDGKDNLGDDTLAEFMQGNLTGRDATNTDVPLQLFLTVSGGTKDKVRIYGMALILHGRLPVQRDKRATGKFGIYPKGSQEFKDSWFNHRPHAEFADVITGSDLGQYEVLLTGWGQKDDGTTYNGSTVDAPIERGSGIAHELLVVHGGYSVNTTPGTLGNFPDALQEETSGEKFIAPIFGPDDTMNFDQTREALQVQAHFDLRRRRSGDWGVVYESNNPHPSQLYPSSTAPVEINIWDIEEGSFEVQVDDWRNIENVVTLRYGHSYGSGRPLGSVRYVNQLSVDLYKQREEKTYDAPWITRKDLSAGDEPAAAFQAHFYGRRKARPLLTTKQTLDQRFHTIEVGHVFSYGASMDRYRCPAHRCGFLDYAFVSESDGTNYAVSSAPKYVAAAGSGRALFFLQQQTDHLRFHVVTPAACTVTGWNYYTGSAFAAHSSVVNPNAVKIAGDQTVSWDWPLLTSWKKSEYTVNGIVRGPSYIIAMDYTGASAQGLGNGVTGYKRTWRGRPFITIEATRRPGRLGDYPKMDVVAKEVM